METVDEWQSTNCNSGLQGARGTIAKVAAHAMILPEIRHSCCAEPREQVKFA